jgi:hypothetical protein
VLVNRQQCHFSSKNEYHAGGEWAIGSGRVRAMLASLRADQTGQTNPFAKYQRELLRIAMNSSTVISFRGLHGKEDSYG